MFCRARGWDFGGWGRDTIFDGSRLNESNIHSFNFFFVKWSRRNLRKMIKMIVW